MIRLYVMDAGQLHKLAKVLRHLATEATSDADEQVSATEALIGMDIFTHSPTSVTDVARRTGVVQSQVSKLTAQMQAMGILTAEKDPSDGRRTVLAVAPAARSAYGTQRGVRDPVPAIEQHLARRDRPHEPADVAHIMKLLDELASLLD